MENIYICVCDKNIAKLWTLIWQYKSKMQCYSFSIGNKNFAQLEK